jgi:hypothetical protein
MQVNLVKLGTMISRYFANTYPWMFSPLTGIPLILFVPDLLNYSCDDNCQ